MEFKGVSVSNKPGLRSECLGFDGVTHQRKYCPCFSFTAVKALPVRSLVPWPSQVLEPDWLCRILNKLDKSNAPKERGAWSSNTHKSRHACYFWLQQTLFYRYKHIYASMHIDTRLLFNRGSPSYIWAYHQELPMALNQIEPSSPRFRPVFETRPRVREKIGLWFFRQGFCC